MRCSRGALLGFLLVPGIACRGVEPAADLAVPDLGADLALRDLPAVDRGSPDLTRPDLASPTDLAACAGGKLCDGGTCNLDGGRCEPACVGTPFVDVCCCAGDEIHPPVCSGGTWDCPKIGRLWTGKACTAPCGPCSHPCPGGDGG